MVHSNNACAGGYGRCLDVKITNACNANCAFCIEANGYSPCDEKSPAELATATVADPCSTVLVLGGEPLMYQHLIEYLSLIRPYKQKLYLTTNGSLLKEPYVDVERLGELLDGINISIHHYNEAKNNTVFHGGTKNPTAGKPKNPVRFETIAAAIPRLKQHNCPVRINCNLIKHMLETRDDIDKMIDRAVKFGADEIRFAELQNAPDVFVSAYPLFDNLPHNPFRDGCEQTIPCEKPITVRVKLTCGRVNPQRKPVTENPTRRAETHVLYRNGVITNGWTQNDCHTSSDGCH